MNQPLRTLKQQYFEAAIAKTFPVGPKTLARIMNSELGHSLSETSPDHWEHLAEVRGAQVLIALRAPLAHALGPIDFSQYEYSTTKAA